MRFNRLLTVLTAAAAGFVLPALPLHCAVETLSGLAANVALRVMEKVTPDLTDPPVRFRVLETADADPFATLEPRGLGQVSAWQIQIFDTDGRKVSWLQGTGRPADAAIPWGGTSPDGKALPDGFYEARLVWLDAAKQAYATQRESISLVTPLEVRSLAGHDLKFSYTSEGLVITLEEKFLFKPGASEIQEAALPALQEVRKFLAAHPENRITIRGYTDSSGPAAANLRLSRERAGRVGRYLAAGGIPASRLSHFGLGAAQPVASNDTPEGRARNRRVDVVMLKPDAPPAAE